jgi:hypothetical protein
MNSKLGIHSVIGPRTGYADFLQRIATAHKTLAVVKCVDDFGPAFEAKRVLPNTLTIGRVNDTPGADMQAIEPLTPAGTYIDARRAAAWYYGLCKPIWTANKKWIDAWETFNEFSAHWGWQGDFYLALMDLAEADGFKLVLYACSSGNPPDACTVLQMLPALRAAKQRGHYLSLHEYGNVGNDIPTLRGTQPYHALRYRHLYEALLIPNQADPPLIISECGQNGGSTFPGVQTFMDDFEWYDSELRKDPYVIGATPFTLGNWAGANFQNALPALADYIASNLPAPAPRQPIFPPFVYGPPGLNASKYLNLRGQPRTQYQRIYVLLPNEPITSDGNARTTAWLKAFVESGVAARYRLTFGFSADDAGVGDLDQRHVLAINPSSWNASLANFFDQNYRGVTYNSIEVSTPEELRNALVNRLTPP